MKEGPGAGAGAVAPAVTVQSNIFKKKDSRKNKGWQDKQRDALKQKRSKRKNGRRR